MKKLQTFISIFPLLFLFNAAIAKDQPIHPFPVAAEDTATKSLLWEISGNGLAAPSYFFGTMHMLCKEDAYLSENLLQAISNSVRVYLEVDMDDMSQIFSAIPLMMMQNDTTLKDLLTEEEYELLSDRLKGKLPLPLGMLNRIKPMFLSAMIGQEGMGCDEPASMEMMIMQEARNRRKDIDGLETMSFQAGLFDKIPYEVQAKELIKSLDTTQSAEEKRLMGELTEAYRHQDLDALERLTMQEGMETDLMNMLLADRNKNWVEQFPEIAREGSMVFAVGAGHLPGKMGVLQLLRDKGYTVKAISNSRGKTL